MAIARCGDYNINHWAHQGRKHCDPWWENETQWHRNWKAHFTETCHEVVLFDPISGEKHIADIKTTGDTIIEFQHSSITEQERFSRETFYLSFAKHMVWVLNMTDDTLRFHFNIGFSRGQRVTLEKDTTINHFGRSKIYQKWAGSKAFVLLDFGGHTLWWLKKYDPVTKIITINPRSKAAFLKKQI
ncbi:MAG: competence protein CoiA [Mucilaginibacter sp.]